MIEGSVALAQTRLPMLERTRRRRVIRCPVAFVPDVNPLIGRVPGLGNDRAGCAVMAGFGEGGGMGLALAE
jgi:dimethylglycine dehydrogenase